MRFFVFVCVCVVLVLENSKARELVGLAADVGYINPTKTRRNMEFKSEKSFVAFYMPLPLLTSPYFAFAS